MVGAYSECLKLSMWMGRKTALTTIMAEMMKDDEIVFKVAFVDGIGQVDKSSVDSRQNLMNQPTMDINLP